jgi:transcriptional regulator with XRE-family HTH domain
VGRRTSPTVRGRELGNLLRGYREAKGLTAVEVAAALEISPSQISRLETAQRQPVILYVRALCKFYELDDQVTARLVRIARESREEGWWQEYDLESPTATYLSLETAATSIRGFENYVVPGLLQTADYASAILEPLRSYLRKEKIAQTVDSRVARQQILTGDNAVQFHVIIDEAVLDHRVGGENVMVAQLETISRCSQLPNVTVQLLPRSVGAHPGMDGPFTVLSFAEEHMDSVVYTEGPLGQIFQDSSDEVSRRLSVFSTLSTLAANPELSYSMLQKRIEELSMKSLRK